MEVILEEKERRIKVLHVLGSMNVGGIQMFLMNIFRNINRQKIMFDFACMNHKNYFQKEIEALGGRVFCIGRHKKIIQHKKCLFNLLDENNYDYIHIHSGNAFCVIDSYLIKKHNLDHKVIYHSHNSSSIYPSLHRICRLFITKYNDYYFACSTEAAKWMFPNEIVQSKNYALITNGIDVEKFLYSEEKKIEVRKEFELEDNFVVGHVGRIANQKNHRFIVEIFAKIVEKRSNAKLVLLGTGPLEEEIRNRVKELGIQQHVLFMGNRDDVERILCGCDVFLFPSLHEGLPLTLIEAQCSGLPCFISDVISDEVKVTPLIQKMSLKNTADEWAEEVCSFEKRNRIEPNKMVAESQYNLACTVEYISKFYKKI